MGIENKSELIREAVDRAGLTPYEHYSGRNMFGQTCFGFQCDNMEDACVDIVCSAQTEEERKALQGILQERRSDQLGKNFIIYFPDIS